MQHLLSQRQGQKLVASVSGSKTDLLRGSGLFRKNGPAFPFRGWFAGAKSWGSYKHSVFDDDPVLSDDCVVFLHGASSAVLIRFARHFLSVFWDLWARWPRNANLVWLLFSR